MCSHVLLCAAVCCSNTRTEKWITVCCIMLKCLALHCSTLQGMAMRCCVLQYAAVYYCMLQYVAACCSVLQRPGRYPPSSSLTSNTSTWSRSEHTRSQYLGRVHIFFLLSRKKIKRKNKFHKISVRKKCHTGRIQFFACGLPPAHVLWLHNYFCKKTKVLKNFVPHKLHMNDWQSKICHMTDRLMHTCRRPVTREHTKTGYQKTEHTATHCNTLQHTATHCNWDAHVPCLIKQRCDAVTKNFNTLQHTATHYDTLQHIATHCNRDAHVPCLIK